MSRTLGWEVAAGGGQHDVDVRMTMGRSLGGLPRGEGKGRRGGGGGGGGGWAGTGSGPCLELGH